MNHSLKQEKSKRENRRLCLTVVGLTFLSALAVGVLTFAVPIVSHDARVSGAWIGTGFAGYFLARLLAAPVGGAWMDKAGPRGPLLIVFAAGTLVPLGCFFSPSLPVLYATQLVMGGVVGLIRPVTLAVLGYEARESSLSGWFSLHALAFNLALFCSPMVSGLLHFHRNMDFVASAVSLLMGVGLCLTLFLVRGSNSGATRHLDEEAASDPVSRLWSVLVALFGRTLCIGLVAAFYPILLVVSLGHAVLLVGLLFAVPTLMVCIGLSLTGRLKRHSNRVPLALSGMALSAFGVLGLGWSETVPLFVAFGLCIGGGAALSLPATMALVSSTSRCQGRAFGKAQVVGGMGMVVGPMLGGLAIQYVQALGAVFHWAGLFALACCLPLLVRFMVETLNYRRVVAVVAGASAAVLLVGVGLLSGVRHSPDMTISESNVYQHTDVAMGTTVKLTVTADSRTAADRAFRRSMDYIREMQRDFDHRNPEGSIGLINSHAGSQWIKPTPRALGLIKRAVDFSRITGGVFDPTIGALTTSPLYYVLDESLARANRELVDYRLVGIREDGQVRLAKAGMALDMGGIAKGAIIDGTVGVLRSMGIRAGIVEAGGDFYCFGDRDWTIGIRHPRENSIYSTVTVRERAVCGSGDYRQFVEIKQAEQSQLRHHIIDPDSLAPANEAVGVTVLADSAEKADALATALFIMGPSRGTRFLGSRYPDVAAMWFTPDLSVVPTDNFPH